MSINATLQGPIAGTPAIGLGQYNLGSLGYVRRGIFSLRHATSYSLAGERGDDGRWDARPAATAPFTTRLVVCRPNQSKNASTAPSWSNGSTSAAASTPHPTGT